MYHKVIIVGHLGRDPELRQTVQGSPVCNFSVAANRRKNDSDQVTWFRVTVWGSQAEACNEYLSKGRQILVEGELKPDTDGHPRIWTGNDGIARTSYEVTASVVKFLGGGQRERDEEPEQSELPF